MSSELPFSVLSNADSLLPGGVTFPPVWNDGELPPPLTFGEVQELVSEFGYILKEDIENAIKFLLYCSTIYYDDAIRDGRENRCYHRLCGGSPLVILRNGVTICSKCGTLEENFKRPDFLRAKTAVDLS